MQMFKCNVIIISFYKQRTSLQYYIPYEVIIRLQEKQIDFVDTIFYYEFIYRMSTFVL